MDYLDDEVDYLNLEAKRRPMTPEREAAIDTIVAFLQYPERIKNLEAFKAKRKEALELISEHSLLWIHISGNQDIPNVYQIFDYECSLWLDNRKDQLLARLEKFCGQSLPAKSRPNYRPIYIFGGARKKPEDMALSMIDEVRECFDILFKIDPLFKQNPQLRTEKEEYCRETTLCFKKHVLAFMVEKALGVILSLDTAEDIEKWRNFMLQTLKDETFAGKYLIFTENTINEAADTCLKKLAQ